MSKPIFKPTSGASRNAAESRREFTIRRGDDVFTVRASPSEWRQFGPRLRRAFRAGVVSGEKRYTGVRMENRVLKQRVCDAEAQIAILRAPLGAAAQAVPDLKFGAATDALSLRRAEEGWGSALPDWVRSVALACDTYTQGQVARALGVSGTTVNRVLQNKYRARLDRVEARARAWLQQTGG